MPNRRTPRVAPGAVSFAPYAGLPALHLVHNAQSFEGGGDWYRRFQYERERDRGLDFEEDLFNPGVLKFALSRQTPATRTGAIASLILWKTGK